MDWVRIGDQVYQISADKDVGKTTFYLTDDYRGETQLEGELWILRKEERRRKKSIDEDTRSTADLIRDLFPPDIVNRHHHHGEASAPTTGTTFKRRTGVPCQGSIKPKRPSPSTSLDPLTPAPVTTPSLPLGPILEEPRLADLTRPSTLSPPKQVRKAVKKPSKRSGQAVPETDHPTSTASSSPDEQKLQRRKQWRSHHHPNGLMKAGDEDLRQPVSDSVEEAQEKQEKVAEAVHQAKERVKAAQREKKEAMIRLEEDAQQLVLQRQESQEKAKKQRQAAIMRCVVVGC